jgi:D-serine deaminase-like pyridoxal phosphate-dependent protein
MNDWSDGIEATPALVIDLPTVERNIDRLAQYGASHNIKIRPHTKTHKSLRMARLQLDAGASGLTCAKIGEAEIMRRMCDDLLIAYPTVDPYRTSHLVRLARDATVRVALDTPGAVEAIGSAARRGEVTVGVLVDLDVGMHRTGVQSPQETLALALKIAHEKALRLDGLFFYPGHLWSPPAEQAIELSKINELLLECRRLWREHGLEISIISGGSTPTAYQSHFMPDLTEIRPGTYIYNDMNTVLRGFCTLDDCAARIVCTVVSDAVPGKVVIDAGSKTLAADQSIPNPEFGHGHVVEFPQAKIVRLSEEHGEVDITACDRAPRVGDRVTVIPNHICPCVNLEDSAWLRLDNGSVEPMPIDARGKLA